jgi:cytochrome c oxidase cbb3-type subunit 2
VRFSFCIIAMAGVLATGGLHPDSAGAGEIAASGRLLYEAQCAICHGLAGDGEGAVAHMFQLRPRDFRRGVFKFRSTPSGSLPTDADLFRTIRRGLPGSAMLPQDHLTDTEVQRLIEYLKTFSPRFAAEPPPTPVPIPLAPAPTAALLEQGRQLYGEMKCPECHGPAGRGDGDSAGQLRDDLGRPLRPADLARRPLKSGDGPEAIYRTLATGVGGTGMPSYLDALTPDELWPLVRYVETFRLPGMADVPTPDELAARHVVQMHQPRRR